MTTTPAPITSREYSPLTLVVARLLAQSHAGLLAYDPERGWIARRDRGADWAKSGGHRRAERAAAKCMAYVRSNRASFGAQAARWPGGVDGNSAMRRAVLNAARQLPELAAPPAGDLAHLTPRR